MGPYTRTLLLGLFGSLCLPAQAQFGTLRDSALDSTGAYTAPPPVSSPGVFSINTNQASGTTITTTNVACSGDNRFAFVFVYSDSGTQNTCTNSESESFTKLYETNYTASWRLACFYKAAPTALSNVVTVTKSGSGESCVFALTLTNAHQSTPLNTVAAIYNAAGGAVTNVSTTTATSASGELVLACSAAPDSVTQTLSVGGGQTLKGYRNYGAGWFAGAISTQAGASPSVVNTFTWAAGDTATGQIAVSVKPP